MHGISDPTVIIAFITFVVAPVVTQLFSIYNANRIEKARKADATEAKTAVVEARTAATEAKTAAEDAAWKQSVANNAVVQQVKVAAERTAEVAKRMDEKTTETLGEIHILVNSTLSNAIEGEVAALTTVAELREILARENENDIELQEAARLARRVADEARSKAERPRTAVVVRE